MSDRKRLTRIFKMHGLSLQASALDTLLDVVQREAEVGRKKADVNNVIFNIIDEIKDRRIQGGNGSGGRSSSVGNIVTSALLEDVVADFRRDSKDVSDDAVQLLDAFHMPRLDFDRMRKNFSLVPFGKEERTLYGEAVAKVSADIFGIIFYMVHVTLYFCAHVTPWHSSIMTRLICSTNGMHSFNNEFYARIFSSQS